MRRETSNIVLAAGASEVLAIEVREIVGETIVPEGHLGVFVRCAIWQVQGPEFRNTFATPRQHPILPLRTGVPLAPQNGRPLQIPDEGCSLDPPVLAYPDRRTTPVVQPDGAVGAPNLSRAVKIWGIGAPIVVMGFIDAGKRDGGVIAGIRHCSLFQMSEDFNRYSASMVGHTENSVILGPVPRFFVSKR